MSPRQIEEMSVDEIVDAIAKRLITKRISEEKFIDRLQAKMIELSIDKTKQKSSKLEDAFDDHQLIRHTIKCENNTWVGFYCKGVINCTADGKNYSSISGFARAHYKKVSPYRTASANGWMECEARTKTGNWIAADSLRPLIG
jgi:hypothetical protein